MPAALPGPLRAESRVAADGGGAGGGDMAVDKELVEFMVCPSCHGKLELVRGEDDTERIVCTVCGLRYPVRDDIPVMLIDEAERPS
jgi:uncharacterized protein